MMIRFGFFIPRCILVGLTLSVAAVAACTDLELSPASLDGSPPETTPDAAADRLRLVEDETAGLQHVPFEAVPPYPRRTLDAPTCDADPLGWLAAGTHAREALGVDAYALRLGETIELTLMDADRDTIGVFEASLQVELDEGTGRAHAWSIEQTLTTPEEDTASQRVNGRALGDGRLFLEHVHQVGTEELLHWAVLDETFTPTTMTLLRVVGPMTEGAQRLPDGRHVLLLEVGVGEARMDQESVDAWLDDVLSDTFLETRALRLLQAVGTDPDLLAGLDAHARRCRLAEREDRENALIRAMVDPSCAEVSSEDNVPKSRCSALDNLVRDLQTLLTINDVMGAVGIGSAITASLVVGGVIVSGPVIGATFVGATVAALVVSSAVDRFVQNNQGAVFDGAGRGGSLVTGDSGDGAAFSSFFGGSNGDPHFDTHDGLAYDFQGVGEFLLVEATEGDPFVVQTRQEPADGDCPHVSVNTAVAMQVEGLRIGFLADELETPFRIDGAPLHLVGEVTPLPSGATIRRDSGANAWIVRWPGGERVRIVRRSRSRSQQLDVQVGLPPHRAGKVRGLLGSFNGDRNDDLRARDGRLFVPPVAWTDLTREFGESWRVAPEASLLDYPDGTDWSTFNDLEFPASPTRFASLPEEARTFAEEVCQERGIQGEAPMASCLLDVACTGDRSFADSHAGRPETEPLNVLPPLERELADGNLEPRPNRILFTFEDLSFEPASHPETVQVSAIREGPSLSIFQVTDAYNYPNSPVLRFSPSQQVVDVDQAVALGTYVEFDVTPMDGPVTVERFFVSMARGANIGPERGLGLRSSHDGFTRTLWSDVVVTNRPEIERFSVPVGGTTLAGPTTFRLYVHTSGSARTLEVGDLALDLAP